jgi:hypothetical protein
MRELIADKFMDVLLEASNGDAVPSSLAKTILYYWQRDQLASNAGLTTVMKAVMEADPAKAIAIIDELGLTELKLAISPGED